MSLLAMSSDCAGCRSRGRQNGTGGRAALRSCCAELAGAESVDRAQCTSLCRGLCEPRSRALRLRGAGDPEFRSRGHRKGGRGRTRGSDGGNPARVRREQQTPILGDGGQRKEKFTYQALAPKTNVAPPLDSGTKLIPETRNELKCNLVPERELGKAGSDVSPTACISGDVTAAQRPAAFSVADDEPCTLEDGITVVECSIDTVS
ncbi:hypothetical protein MRX96_017799 [Rhipicephalus microplus]